PFDTLRTGSQFPRSRRTVARGRKCTDARCWRAGSAPAGTSYRLGPDAHFYPGVIAGPGSAPSSDMPGREDMPSTIRKSDKRAQEIYIKTHDSAVEQYGEGQPAHRTAFASLKNEYRKTGDR